MFFWILITALSLLLLLLVLGWNKGVPVLLYHQVNPLSATTPEEFERELAWIRQEGYKTFTVAEWLQQGRLPSKSIVITFDDGYYDNYFFVFPLLKKYNIKATFFLNTAYIPLDQPDRSKTIIRRSSEFSAELAAKFYRTGSGASEQYMSAQEIKEMFDSGLCDFQAHSHAHKVVFKKPLFKRFVRKEKFSADEFHVYGAAVEEGFPVFLSRGESSIRAFIPHEHYARAVQEMLATEWNELLPWQQEVEAAAFGVAAELRDMGRYEQAEEFSARVIAEITTNLDAVESITGKRPLAYAWPYGHHSEEGRKVITTTGVKMFLTCKKGTNASSPDWNKIRRIELRKPSVKKLSFVTKINSNRFAGFLFGLLS